MHESWKENIQYSKFSWCFYEAQNIKVFNLCLIDPKKLEADIVDEKYEYRNKLHPLAEKIIESFEVKGNKTPEINYNNLTKKDIARIQAVYLGMCAEVDFNIKKILKALEDSGQSDNTMIIFTSDHGEMLGQHKMFGKKGWWDQSYRIPLIIHTPNCKSQMINEMTESVDLLPTIINWLGGEIPIDCNGRSLISNIENGKANLPIRDYVIFEWDFSVNSMCHTGWPIKNGPPIVVK